MEKNFKTLKAELKIEASDLHNIKAETKKTQRENGSASACTLQYTILKMKRDYRHRHIAYSLMKGRTYEQIEPKCAENNKPDHELIQRIISEYNTTNVRACA